MQRDLGADVVDEALRPRELAAVVGVEEDDRVVGQSGLLEFLAAGPRPARP